MNISVPVKISKIWIFKNVCVFFFIFTSSGAVLSKHLFGKSLVGEIFH